MNVPSDVSSNDSFSNPSCDSSDDSNVCESPRTSQMVISVVI
jgi:hypothetical protein